MLSASQLMYAKLIIGGPTGVPGEKNFFQRKKNERKGFAVVRALRRIAKRAQANATERKQTFSVVVLPYQYTHYFGPHWGPKKRKEALLPFPLLDTMAIAPIELYVSSTIDK